MAERDDFAVDWEALKDAAGPRNQAHNYLEIDAMIDRIEAALTAANEDAKEARAVLRRISGYGRSKVEGWPGGESVISAAAADEAREYLRLHAERVK